VVVCLPWWTSSSGHGSWWARWSADDADDAWARYGARRSRTAAVDSSAAPVVAAVPASAAGPLARASGADLALG
jgi:hypothetical protein